MRDYGVDGQLGLERTPEEYVAKVVEIFGEVRRVLAGDGTLWLNLGDSYASAWACSRRNIIGNGSPDDDCQRPNRISDGLKEKDLIGIPWRVALALQADGWWLRSDIIWSKPNPMPESVTDRPTKAHEYLFLLAKSERYRYDAELIAEKCNWPEGSWSRSKCYDGDQSGMLRSFYGTGAQWKGGETRNRRSVWTVATQPYPGAHFATFPPDLIKPCILAGCPVGGTVLDPFLGSGTTAQVARQCGCKCVGIELNEKYIKLAMKRLRQKVLMFDSGDSEPVRTRIAE